VVLPHKYGKLVACLQKLKLELIEYYMLRIVTSMQATVTGQGGPTYPISKNAVITPILTRRIEVKVFLDSLALVWTVSGLNKIKGHNIQRSIEMETNLV
jgi:hypothetical protein